MDITRVDTFSQGLSGTPPAGLSAARAERFRQEAPSAIPRDQAIAPGQQDQQGSSSEEELSKYLENSVDRMNKLMQTLNNSLQFSLDKDTGKTVVKVVDASTQEVIKQFPSEEALALTKAFDKITGLLVQNEA